MRKVKFLPTRDCEAGHGPCIRDESKHSFLVENLHWHIDVCKHNMFTCSKTPHVVCCDGTVAMW